jgi:hypothetical protein
LTDQISAPHARDVLERGTPIPAPLEAASDSLGGATVGVTSLHFLNAEKNDRAAMMQGMTAMGFGLRGGTNGAIEGYADYATSDDASRAYTAFQSSCADKPESCALEPGMFGDAKAERSGARIALTLAFSRAALRSLQDLAP